jgi:hypothetical protein
MSSGAVRNDVWRPWQPRKLKDGAIGGDRDFLARRGRRCGRYFSLSALMPARAEDLAYVAEAFRIGSRQTPSEFPEASNRVQRMLLRPLLA